MKQQKKQNQTKSATDLAGSQDDLIALKAEKQRLNYKAPRLNKKIRKLQTELSSLDGQGATKGGLSPKAKQQKIAELEKSLKQVQNERAELDSAREQISAKIQSADPTSTSIKPKAKADTKKTKAVKSGQSTGKVTEADSKRLIPQYQRNHEKLAQLITEKADLDRSIKAVHEKIRNRQQRQKSLEEKSLKELGLTEEAKIQSQVDLKVEEKNLATERDKSIAVREKLKSEIDKLTQTLEGIESKLGYTPDVVTKIVQTQVNLAKSDKAESNQVKESEMVSDGADIGEVKPSDEVEQSATELNQKQAELEKFRIQVRTFTTNIKGLNAKIRRVESNIAKLESQSSKESGLSEAEKSKSFGELNSDLQRLQKERDESESGRTKLKPKVDELVIAIKAIEKDVPGSAIKSQAKSKAVSDDTRETKSTAVSKRDSEVYELTPDQTKFAPESSPYTGLRRLRKFFGSIEEISKMPNLIEVQRDSYFKFVQMYKSGDGKENEAGLESVFKSIFPITNHTETATLEYISYTVEKPKFEVEECRQRGMTYSLPLKVTLRLIVFDVDEDTKSRTVKDIKEQEVYMGELPLMTNTGTFIVNGSERVIVSQMHRSPGVFFDHDKGKSHSSGKFLFSGRVIPYRGSWLDIEFDAKDIVYARIDRKRKFPVTTLLMALGLDAEQILSTFYDTVSYIKSRNQWRVKFDSNRFVGTTVTDDIVDAKTKKVVLEAGKRFTRRHANQFEEQGIKEILVNSDNLIGSFIAEDIANLETGEIIAEIGAELTESLIQEAEELGYKDLTVLDIDYVNVGPYILNTLAVDKNIDRETALKDIYRVLRPGDPPTLDIAEELFEKLFFSEERYDLSSVGRVKMNMRLDLDCDPDVKILRKEDIIGLIQQLLLLRDGKGEIDDIDNLGNRRVRSVGELMENQYRIGLTRLERATKEKMSSTDIATAMPQDLINAKPAVSAMREFFGSSQLSQFMDQTNPLSEITHKRRLSALGPGGLTRERAGFEVRDVHTTHYGRICPIETPEGQNIGLINSLATFARVNEYGFIESPYRKIVDGAVTNEIEYLSAIEEAKYHIAPSDEKVENGKLASDLVSCRFAGEPTMIPRERIEFMDVSPKQVVSVAASLIPFLENDDAHRALMGSNMQRQAVPLVQSEAPFVGTGMEREVARDSGAAIVAGRTGNVMQVDANRIVVSVTEDYDPSKRGVDIYRLRKYQRSNQNTCVNQRPIVKVGDHVMKGDIIADGPSTDLGELALGRNVLVAFMPWNGYNFEDSILLSERIVHEDVFTSIHIEEFEVSARDTKLGPEEITRDIPNVSEEMLRNLDEAGMIYVGAEVKANDILVGKVTPKGEEVITPEEKLLRAIFGEKASEVSDTSLRVPVGVTGTVVEVRVFNRHGVEKDERALSNEREEIERIFKDHEDERKILNQNVYDRVKAQILGKKATRGPQGYKKNTEITEEFLADCLQTEWWQFVFSDNKMMSELEAMRKLYDENVKELKASFEEKRDKIQSGDELMPSVMKMVKVFVAVKRKLQPGDKMAGRHGNKGVVSKINPIEDMPFLEDGTPVDIVLNPLGVPSRMNVGQILETHLGMASVGLGRQIAEMYEEYQRNGKIEKLRNKIAEIYGENTKGESIQDIDDKGLITLSKQLKKGVPIATPVFDGAKESDVSDLLEENKFDRSGQMAVFDGRTGEPFERKVTVGYKYILKLHHLVDEKIHARSVGPYSLVTQQPLGGKAQFGGQRFGEMEVWALEAYGAAYTLQEILTIKSDDVAGRTKLYESIVKGDDTFVAGIPESFNVLVKEIQSLGLNIEMRDSAFFDYHDDDGDLIEEAPE